MKSIQLAVFFLCVLSKLNIEATTVYSLRGATVTVNSTSFYIPAYYKHFISNVSFIRSIFRCALACQNNEYCRTANYNASSLVCSLYEEYSFVGQIVSSTSTDLSTLSFSLCPNDNMREPLYACFGTPLRSPVNIENLFNQTLQTTPTIIYASANSATWSTKLVSGAPMWNYNSISLMDANNAYYRLDVITPVPSISVIASIDTDDYTFYAIIASTSRLYLACPAFNKTIYPTSINAVCMSDKYVVAVPTSAANKTLYVYWKNNGSKAFLLPAPTNGVSACLFANGSLFIAGKSPDPAIQSIPLQANLLVNNYSSIVPISACRSPTSFLKIDSSGRLFTICKNATSKNMLIFTMQGSILARVQNLPLSNYELGIKVTKYRFSYGTSASSPGCSFYDF